jgi:hypothetical protein
MPTRKQKRRQAKSKRHEYEFVYVDDEGNEVDAPPEEEEPRHERRNGTKPAASPAKKASPQRGARRVPQPPSWNRSVKRGLLFGAFAVVFVSLVSKGHYLQALPFAVLYGLFFIPFTYWMDKAMYRRWQARQERQSSTKR